MKKFLTLGFSPAKALSQALKLTTVWTLVGLLSPLFLFAQPKVKLVNFASGFDLPLDITHCGDSRLFVVERDGVIWVHDSLGNRLDTFLNIDPRVNSGQNEQGLLGLAFHPNYAENGYFFVNYTKNNGGDTRVARFSVKPNNPNEADPNSELTILEQDQPAWNHNGGCVKFGPDGYLYISLGDGGGANDPSNYAQNKKNLLGKILRIDVNNSSASEPYKVPTDNPFVGNADYLPEIWSLGWRNPWRFSFDRLTGDMWIGDVGQNLWEEVDFEPANTPGLNYGWRCYEGTHTFNTTGCQPASAYVSPFFDYSHSGGNGCSVTGGFIYRGSKFPDLYGCYLFADYCSGRWWYTKRLATGTFSTNVLGNFGAYEFSSFGEGHDGELYVALLSSGKVQRVEELCSPFQVSGMAGPGVCAGAMAGEISLDATGAMGPVSYTWSNGASTQNLSNLEPGIYSVEVKDGNNCIRRDTFEIENASPVVPQLSLADTTICLGNPIAFQIPPAPTGYDYQWYINASPIPAPSDNIFFPVSASSYQVQLVGQPCNSDLSTPVLVNVSPTPTVLLSVEGDTLRASFDPPNSTVQWYFGIGNPIPNASDPELIAEQSGLYIVAVTDPNGCIAYAETYVEVSTTTLPTSVSHFSLSPNPTENSILLELELKKTERVNITLADSSQRQVFTKNIESQRIALPIDMNNLPGGTYFLTIKTERGSFVRKVMKK
ncbi:MAG: PQQ-dependent sugar dehydrogenase [Saprospiraceae bacterium]|nr:PQQ-dependent sugar dehydrogenase [Saprospiraceae bacterium]